MQSLKAKHQLCLDGGRWDSAWLLTGCEDRTSRTAFAGSDQEMSRIAAYRKAMRELKGKIAKNDLDVSSDGEETDEGEGHRRKKKKKKKKKTKGKGGNGQSPLPPPAKPP